jgi:hypothetical protein
MEEAEESRLFSHYGKEAHGQNLCKFLDSRLRGNDVMPVKTGIQRGGGLPLATNAQI